jgi:diguanylate cyclase (GGDEF)-like protein
MVYLYRILRYWAYLLVLVPLFTDWVETGHLPRAPRETLTEFTVGIILAIGISIIYRDMAKLQAMAQTDALTGLFNRRRFFERLEQEVARAQRLDIPLSLAYLDVDEFKAINDEHGHATGDQVLREVAHLLAHGERRWVDSCFRLGGDEFAVLLECAPAGDAAHALHRIVGEHGRECAALRRHRVRLSYGVAQLLAGETADAFLHRADALMYETKRQPERERLSVPDG